MTKKNGQFHLTLETETLNKLRVEAESLEVSTAELIRRKLENPPTDEEVILIRKIKQVLSEKERRRK